jgi:hypothetical protein
MTETTNTPDTITYHVPAKNLEKLTGLIADLNKRVAKLQKKGYEVEPITLKVGPAYLVELSNHNPATGETVTREIPFHEVVLVSPKPPKANGWEFVAALTHVEGVGAVIRVVPGANVAEGELSRFHEASALNCDHCKVKNSRRTETFILRKVQ